MRVKEKLQNIRVRPSKERGQNFLIDSDVIARIVEFGNPPPDVPVIEIGPGLGALTDRLYARGPLTVIEVEREFCNELAKKFPEIRIVNQDVRTVDFSQFGNNLLVFGNLPYSLSTEIVFHLIDHHHVISRAVLMLQKEFADRMGASPGGRDYGVLSISCQLMADITLGPIVKGNSFHPPTRVDSRVLELKFFRQPRFPIEDIVWFKKVVKGAFLQRRKKIHNSLKASGIRTAVQIDAALDSAGIDPGRRAETLSIEEFVRLSNDLRG